MFCLAKSEHVSTCRPAEATNRRMIADEIYFNICKAVDFTRNKRVARV